MHAFTLLAVAAFGAFAAADQDSTVYLIVCFRIRIVWRNVTNNLSSVTAKSPLTAAMV